MMRLGQGSNFDLLSGVKPLQLVVQQHVEEAVVQEQAITADPSLREHTGADKVSQPASWSQSVARPRTAPPRS